MEDAVPHLPDASGRLIPLDRMRADSGAIPSAWTRVSPESSSESSLLPMRPRRKKSVAFRPCQDSDVTQCSGACQRERDTHQHDAGRCACVPLRRRESREECDTPFKNADHPERDTQLAYVCRTRRDTQALNANQVFGEAHSASVRRTSNDPQTENASRTSHATHPRRASHLTDELRTWHASHCHKDR